MMLILHDILTFYEKPHLSQPLVTEYPTSAQYLSPKLDPKKVEDFKKRVTAEKGAYRNVVPHTPFKNKRPKHVPTKVTLGKGTPEASKKLLAFCRRNGITIGTYLMAAFSFINSKITVSYFISFYFKNHC